MSNPKDMTTDKPTPWSKLGIATSPISAVHDLLDILWANDKKITVCLIGETGVGKSPIVAQWAKKRGGYIRVINFGHLNPEDVSMSIFNETGTQYDNIPPSWLVELNEKAEELGTAVLFLDEWNRGEKALVNALFTLCDERRIHSFHLHPNVLVVAAMNPSDGSYLVNQAERDHAIRKRLNFVYTVHDLAGWLRHAREEGYHHYVTSYVAATPTHFYDAAARDAGKAFACPSNWEKVSNLLKAVEKMGKPITDNLALVTLVKGQIGHTIGDIFMQYVENQDTIIAPSAVLEDYPKNRDRVARLLGCTAGKDGFTVSTGAEAKDRKIRADTISNLNSSLAMVLYSEQPEPETVAPNLARYLVDLPDEYFMQFIAENMASQIRTAKNGPLYTRQLNAALKQYEPYLKRTNALSAQMQELGERLRKGAA